MENKDIDYSEKLPDREFTRYVVDVNTTKTLTANPWLEQLAAQLPMKNKRAQVAALPDQDITNKKTGEVERGLVKVYREYTVDTAVYVKVLADEMRDVFLLEPAGHSMFLFFCYLLTFPENMKKTALRATLPMYMNLVESSTGQPLKKMGQTAFYRGIKDLILKGFICRAVVNGDKTGWFFINPNRMMNGDRIIIAKSYVIGKREEAVKTRVEMGTYTTQASDNMMTDDFTGDGLGDLHFGESANDVADFDTDTTNEEEKNAG